MTLLARLLQRKSTLTAQLKQTAPRVPSSGPAAVPPVSPPISPPDPGVAMRMAEANAMFQAGNLAEAREAYKRVLELDPRHARAFYMLSGVAAQDGDVDSAVGLMRRAIALQPSVAEFHFSLGSLFAARDDQQQALASYQAALQLQPDVVEWRRELASALRSAGRLEEAVAAYRAALRKGKADAQVWFDLGFTLQEAKRYKEAEEAFLESTRLAPDAGAAYVNLAMARRDQGQGVEAEAPARRAVELLPDLPQAWFVLGNALTKQARHREAIDRYRKAIELLPEYDVAWSALLYSLNYADSVTQREIYQTHVKWGESFPRVPPMLIDPSRAQPGHRIRVGYLSADFRDHAVAYFLEPILQHHDASQFEVFAYHTGRHEDAFTTRLKSYVEHWRRPPADLKHEDLEHVLRNDQLDILVELSGHTDGQRLAVLARRVAPVQVTYLGYPNTTGLHTIDYRITDARADPPGEADTLHVETLVRLPEAFLCYAPPTIAPVSPLPPFKRKGHITFGSFNNFAKISQASVTLWSRILLRVPESKLLLKHLALRDPGLQQLLHDRFQAQGVTPDRVLVVQPTLGHREHLETYAEVDIALDTFPYHGTTTTTEALWMGVPVVTLQGDRHASRVGVSLLSVVGLPELIAQTSDEYVEIAARLAAEPAKLEEFRRTLRSKVANSRLTDGPRFARDLEQAYREMWRKAIDRSQAA